MAGNWNHDRAKGQIDARINELRTITVKDYTRDMSLENIKRTEAYRVDAVHLYADILNVKDMLDVTSTEGVQCHRRVLRFLDLHYRAASRVLDKVGARRVDFHNQRLHGIFAKPYNTEEGAEKRRVQKAVATGQLIIDVLAQVNDEDDPLDAAKVRIGIDSGKALAVNNGRAGNREPLFLGNPANQAAKMAAGADTGIYLTNDARRVLGLSERANPKRSPLTALEIEECQAAAKLDVTVDEIIEGWEDDLERRPLGAIEFYRATPPLKDLDIMKLTPANSRRQEAVSIYADIDGFTQYVIDHIDNKAADVARTLHVIRAELERVLTSDFGGRRVRFIGDCVHGLLCEGTAHTTDTEATISAATLLAGALRSSFELALERLQANGYETGELGLAIGFEYGWMTVTRLGLHGDGRVRCSVSRGVFASEQCQAACSGRETSLGEEAYKYGSAAVRKIFGSSRKVRDLDYNEAFEALNENEDATAKAVRDETFAGAPYIAKVLETEVRPYAKSETR